MQPPDNNLVGLLSLGMCGLGMVLDILLYWLVGNKRLLARLLPQSRSRSAYWIGMAVLAPMTLASFLALPTAIQALAVISSFGWEAYADGLRVINKHGLLSDGRYLGVFWAAAIGAWILPLWLMIVMPATIWHLHFVEGGLRRKP